VPHRSNQSGTFLRVSQIIGDPKADPPIEPIIPVGRSTWWKWCRDGRAPKSVKLSQRITAWRSADIAALVDSLNANKSRSE
jgi:prophage regulatory protein